MGEVLMLAAESLRAVSPAFALDVSHLGYIAALLPELGLEGEAASAALRARGESGCAAINTSLREATSPIQCL